MADRDCFLMASGSDKMHRDQTSGLQYHLLCWNAGWLQGILEQYPWRGHMTVTTYFGWSQVMSAKTGSDGRAAAPLSVVTCVVIFAILCNKVVFFMHYTMRDSLMSLPARRIPHFKVLYTWKFGNSVHHHKCQQEEQIWKELHFMWSLRLSPMRGKRILTWELAGQF